MSSRASRLPVWMTLFFLDIYDSHYLHEGMSESVLKLEYRSR